MLVVEQYERLSDLERVKYLESHVAEDTDLGESFLVGALESEVNPQAKWLLVKGLGIRRSRSAVALILRICRGPNASIGGGSLHAICAWSLGRIGQSAFHGVAALLEDSSPDTRKCAVDALGELRDARGIEAVRVALEKDVPEVQLWAALTLAKIGQPSVRSLHDVMARTSGRTRLLVLDAICRIGSRDSVPVISKVLRQGLREERLWILERGQAFYSELKEDLVACVRLADKEVSESAASALRAIGSS